MFILGTMQFEETRSDFFSTEFGAKVVVAMSNFLQRNNCQLDALLSETLDSASAEGEHLMDEFKTLELCCDDQATAQHTLFTVTLFQRLGVYCASRKEERRQNPVTLPMQLLPSMVNYFQQLAVHSINNMLMNAKLASISGSTV